jgi:2-oxoisovalerate dehydrogenase E1 component
VLVSDRVAVVEAALDAALDVLVAGAPRIEPAQELAAGLTAGAALELWSDMARSRALDVAARRMRAAGTGHYTIASAGHERTSLVAAALRADDPALLHYRDGGFVMTRQRIAGLDPVPATVAALAADHREPASGGRHKVWGSAPAWIMPQTSTIASHVPKATGLALALDRASRLGWELPVADDAVVVASMGDASINHASALSGVNAAVYGRRRGVGVPLLLVVEDNGLGISTPTPSGWVEAWGRSWPHLEYLRVADDVRTAWHQITTAVARVRQERAPVLLHLPTVRLWGHAGSDVERGYRSVEEIRADELRDPLPALARELASLGVADGPQLRARLAAARDEVAAAVDALDPPAPLASRAAVTASLYEHDDAAVRVAVEAMDPGDRRALHDGLLPEEATQPGRRTLAAYTNAALREILAADPRTLVLGEDVGRKGGVYGVTNALQEQFGPHRVVDTLLDETGILGAAQGAALVGQLPIVEIQYLAYLHNAIDQLRGEAASTQFFSDGAFRTPMVVRMASFADPQGFGGHFHNDHAVAALREIPGVAICVPSRGDQAVALLRTAVSMARRHGRVVLVLEPTALYHRRDLFNEGDEQWLSDWPEPHTVALPGQVGLAGPEEADVVLVTAGNGVPLSMQAAARLVDDGIRAQIVDVRWLAPLPVEAVRRISQRVGRAVVVDECRASGGWADAMVAGLVRRGFSGRLATVSAADSYVPIGPAAPTVLIDEDEVVDVARDLVRG